jgi:hypothetical protein
MPMASLFWLGINWLALSATLDQAEEYPLLLFREMGQPASD